ncbi:MAG: non-canonical purine NTP pyrophosphatase, partial [Ruminococcus sp.]|nr:non-canonical purine NTP pyrophosphatase [Ruminococcus sp.]
GLAPVGDGGFGYDPVFMVGEKSFSQLSAEEKDQCSHRGNALRELKLKLEEYLEVNKC